MFKYIVLAILVAVASAAPAADPLPDPKAAAHASPHPAPQPAPALPVEASLASEGEHQASLQPNAAPLAAAPVAVSPAHAPAAKQLFFAELPLVKTPASTAKLTPVAAPVLAPLAYAAPTILTSYPAWNGLAAVPATYSIEQHGYQITY